MLRWKVFIALQKQPTNSETFVLNNSCYISVLLYNTFLLFQAHFHGILIFNLFQIEQKIFGMAASDFVAPRLTGEKKDSGPPGLLGLKTLSLVKSTNYNFREQLISKGEVC